MSTSSTAVAKALDGSFIFPLLSMSEREQFIKAARLRSYRAGELIFQMGDPGDSMMLIETGEVIITYPAADGRTAILGELKPGSVFGEIALLDGEPRSAAATASTNCLLVEFERRTFVEMLRTNWLLTEAVLKLVCARLRRSDSRMADLAFSDLPGRLARTLVARARPAPGGGPPRLTDSQSALAALAGGSRENVNRWLRKWHKQGLISVGDGRIRVLDPDGLLRANT